MLALNTIQSVNTNWDSFSIKDHAMNKDEFEGKWKQIQGQTKQWWGKLTDDDLGQVGGQFEKFMGVLQAKYGYTREVAESEFNKRMAEFEANKQKRG